MRAESVIGGGANSAAEMNLVADLAGSLLHEMERLGVVTAAEAGFETVAERMSNEAIARGSVIVGRTGIGAWCRVPYAPAHVNNKSVK
jgi:hypothetical protein